MAFLSELNCGTLTFEIPLAIVVHKHVECQDNSTLFLFFLLKNQVLNESLFKKKKKNMSLVCPEILDFGEKWIGKAQKTNTFGVCCVSLL